MHLCAAGTEEWMQPMRKQVNLGNIDVCLVSLEMWHN